MTVKPIQSDSEQVLSSDRLRAPTDSKIFSTGTHHPRLKLTINKISYTFYTPAIMAATLWAFIARYKIESGTLLLIMLIIEGCYHLSIRWIYGDIAKAQGLRLHRSLPVPLLENGFRLARSYHQSEVLLSREGRTSFGALKSTLVCAIDALNHWCRWNWWL